MDRFEVVRAAHLVDKTLPLALAVVVLVAHCVDTNVESKADRLRGILEVAASLDDVFRSDVEGSRTIFLLETS